MTQLEVLIEIILRVIERGRITTHDQDRFYGVYREYTGERQEYGL